MLTELERDLRDLSRLQVARTLVAADDQRTGEWPRELRFYHGTSRANAEAILHDGFQQDFSRDVSCLGRGVYVGRPDKALRFARNKAWHGGDEGALLEVLVSIARPKFVSEDDLGWQAEGYDACRADHTSRSNHMEWCIADPAACKPTGKLLLVPIDEAPEHNMVETAEWVGPAQAPASANDAEEAQEERRMEEIAAKAQEEGAGARPPQARAGTEEAAGIGEIATEIEEVEEIATEHMEISMEVHFPEPTSAASSQLAPLVQEGIRSDAASAVERLRAAGAWQCDSASCGAVGNAPWQPCKRCGKKKPVGAMVGALTAAVAVLKQTLDVTAALAAAEAGADSTQLAYGMGARAGCAAGMQDATDKAPLPAAFRGCDVAQLLGGPQEEQPRAVRRFVDAAGAAEHLKKRKRDDGGDDDEMDTARITRRLVEPQPTARREPQMAPQMAPPPPRPLQRRAGDWDCGYCGKWVFGSRVACFNCNRPRPGYEREAERQRERERQERRSRERSSSQPSERSRGSRGQTSQTSRATSQMTLVETGHLKQREGERAIVRRELQACLKHGRARRTGKLRWEVEYQGITLVTNDDKKIGVTAYWTGGGGRCRPDWAESMEANQKKDEELRQEGSASVFFPFDLTEDRLPPLPESPRGTPRSELGSISHASPRSEPESPRSAAPSEGVEAADNRGFDDAAEAPEQPGRCLRAAPTVLGDTECHVPLEQVTYEDWDQLGWAPSVVYPADIPPAVFAAAAEDEEAEGDEARVPGKMSGWLAPLVRSASREPSHSRGTGGGGGSRSSGGGWPGTAVAEETMWWRVAGGGSDELRFKPGLVGAIFLTNQSNEEECLCRGLFGLPNRHVPRQAAIIRDIDAAPESTLIFLYNFQQRKMGGVFVAAGRARFPLHADAWTHADPRPGTDPRPDTRRRKTGRTGFSAQACSRSVAVPTCNRSHTILQPHAHLAPCLHAQLPVAWHGARRGLPQLPLDRFRHLLRYEGSSTHFEQVLDETQVHSK